MESRWRRKWQPTLVLLPGKSHGRRSLVSYSPWVWEVLDMTEWLHFHFSGIGERNGNLLQCSCLERIPETEEPGALQSMGSHRVRHDWSDLAAVAACCSPQWLYQFAFPPTVWEASLFSIPSPAFIVYRFFDDGHSDQCEVIIHYSFDLLLSNNEQCWASFHVFINHLYVFFGEMSI